jgi:hypothetical protein
VAERIFQGLSGLALLYCLVAGRRWTADCLSGEKRDGTLGLLFLTDLKGHDVVLGKLAATSLSGFYGLLAMVPVLAVPLPLGGLTQGEFWRLVLVLVNTFLFSLAVGIFVSAATQDSRRAFGANFLVLLLISVLPPACAGTIAYFSPTHRVVAPLLYSCPAYSLFVSYESHYRWEAGHFWCSVALTHALTWLLVGLACRLVPRSWQDRPGEAGVIRWRDRLRVWAYGQPAKRRSFRKRLLDRNAFYWLASRVWLKPALVWVCLAVVALWWLFVWLRLQFNWFEESFAFTTALLLSSLLKLWIAVEAGQRLADDQKIGALELLLSTPLGARDIVRGQWLALRRQFLWPLALTLAVEMFLTVAVSRHSAQDRTFFFVFGVASVLLLLTDITALVWVAMAAALTARSPNHASVGTIVRVLILPRVLFGAISALVGTWFAFRSSSTGPGWKFYVGLWFGLGLLADLAFGLPAWWRLRTRFRRLALQRFTSARRREAQ